MKEEEAINDTGSDAAMPQAMCHIFECVTPQQSFAVLHWASCAPTGDSVESCRPQDLSVPIAASLKPWFGSPSVMSDAV